MLRKGTKRYETAARRSLDIKDMIAFHANNVTDLREAFVESVDDYLDTCADF